jgi:hypothetical protein
MVIFYLYLFKNARAKREGVEYAPREVNDLEYVKSSMGIKGNLQPMTAKIWPENIQIIVSSCPFLSAGNTV